MFSLRIFTINYYLTKPEKDLDYVYSDFRCLEVKHVPVIRIFGTTPEGQKSCLHVHNVFPYLLVRPFRSANDNKRDLDKYMYELGNQIDKTLNMALCIKDQISTQHVFKIEPILTKSMYGYHDKDSLFLKIQLYNPDLIKKLSDLLINGSIMGESLQTYEAHIPFNLQFLMDYNLFGMNFIHLKSVKFRRLPLNDDENNQNILIKSQTISSDENKKWIITDLSNDQLLPQEIERQSVCELELDGIAADILNPQMDKDGFMLNPGLSALWQEETDRRKLLEITKPLDTPDLEERTNVLKLENEIELRDRLVSLLEARFNSKYPFKVNQNEDPNQLINRNIQDDDDDINDDSILDILNELHNDSLNGQDEDLDNSMLHATQLNDEDKEVIMDENDQMNELTCKLKDEQLQEKLNSSIEKENEEFLKESDDESFSSTSSEEINDNINNSLEKKSLLNLSSSSSSSSSADSSFNENKSEEDTATQSQTSTLRTIEHHCTYFDTDLSSAIETCVHKLNEKLNKNRKSICQNICINCEYSKDFKDSLDHMAFLSPDESKKSPNKFDLKFDSPTLEKNVQTETENLEKEPEITNENEQSESPSIINDTITDETDVNLEETQNNKDNTNFKFNQSQMNYSFKQFKQKSKTSNSSKISSKRSSLSETVISDTTLMLSDSDSDDDKSFMNYYEAYKTRKYELKRKRALEDSEINDKSLIMLESYNNSKMSNQFSLINVPILSNETWFCPNFNPPTVDDLENKFKPNNEAIVKYYKKRGKFKMKINLTEFKTDIVKDDYKEYFIKNLDENENESCWFTPAICLPSVKRIHNKIKANEAYIQNRKNRKLKKLEKVLSSQSQKKSQAMNSQTEKTLESIISSNETNKSENKQLIPQKSILTKKNSNENKNSKLDTPLRKKKTVRFDDRTQFLNENIEDYETTKTEKGHFLVESILKNENFENIDETKLKSTRIKLIKDDDLLSNPISSIDSKKTRTDSSSSNEIWTSLDSKSNDTVILEEDEANLTNNLNTSKPSFYEYDSILFPKTSKYIDCSSYGNMHEMSTIIEKEDEGDETLSNEPKRIAKKDKKIINDSDLLINKPCHLTIMSLELHVNTRGNLTPNPDHDQIGFICYTIYEQKPTSSCIFDESTFENHLLIFDQNKRSLSTKRYLGLESTRFLSKNTFKSIEFVYQEQDLFDLMVKAIRKYDPDILVGFEIQKLSWCYLVRRALKLNINEFIMLISRVPKGKRENVLRISFNKPNDPNKKQIGPKVDIIPIPLEIVIAGRVVLNLWRILRHEVSLNIYSLENCCYHILNERVPKYSFSSLTSWFIHLSDLYRWKTIDYYLYRTQANLRIMSSIDLINKTSEFARVYGIEFYHVLSRGSQYRVESMMLRIARKLNFVALSASLKSKRQMRAPECLPLTLEPESRFYTEPVAVLDFQSLYPSVIIAYNICFTTCLGRIESIGKEGCFKFGCSSLFLPDNVIKSLDLDKDIYIAPNGVAFVKQHIRQGVLPIMLEDILKTRVMVKNSMKLYKDENLYKVFDSRQLGLKLIANVTFGYTAANFSGRMPCVEVGDTIVRVARQTLENSIKYVQLNIKKYGGRVVYGDTDSLFVLFEKKTKQESFDLSYKIVDEITNMNTKPVKLKFEKIYLPSILLAKKRYLGYMFESPDQPEAVLDVKGIEIIRRDGCLISARTLERCCKILFEFKDVEKVKDYLVKQCIKLVNGKINLKDFIIAKEYRGRETYDNVKSIAACQIANKKLQKDPLAEPLTGERVPYIIVYGMPGLPLYDLVRSPAELLENPDLKLNYEYYVMKQIIPPLNRIMVLMNINCADWVRKLSFKPKIFQYLADDNQLQINPNQPITITNYIFSNDCVLCGCKKQDREGLCGKCSNLNQYDLAKLRVKFQKCERKYSNLIKVCQMCTYDWKNMKSGDCISLDCPNNFTCVSAKQDLKKSNYIRKIIDNLF